MSVLGNMRNVTQFRPQVFRAVINNLIKEETETVVNTKHLVVNQFETLLSMRVHNFKVSNVICSCAKHPMAIPNQTKYQLITSSTIPTQRKKKLSHFQNDCLYFYFQINKNNFNSIALKMK